MSTIDHKSTAKAALRSIIAAHGKTGTLALLSGVLKEELPARRGRPTREERVTRMVVTSLDAVIPDVADAEQWALDIAELLAE